LLWAWPIRLEFSTNEPELAVLDGVPLSHFDVELAEQELRGYLKDWSSLTSRHPAQTRQILRKLLPSRIRLSHDSDGTYRFAGEAAVGRVIGGMLGNHEGKRSGVPNRNMTLSMPHLGHLIIPFSGEIQARAA
jgi:hypothetical protein